MQRYMTPFCITPERVLKSHFRSLCNVTHTHTHTQLRAAAASVTCAAALTKHRGVPGTFTACILSTACIMYNLLSSAILCYVLL
jgi:hypothetical protein